MPENITAPTASTVSPASPVVIVIAVGSSDDGGLEALTAILRPLPRDFPAAVLVGMHRETEDRRDLAEALAMVTALTVCEARSGDRILPGFAYLAPRNYHLVVTPLGVLWLTVESKVHGARPAADPLFQSAAAVCGDRAIGVILTGEDGDGAAGIKAIKGAGGSTIAQDETTSANPSMPGTAAATGQVDLILPLHQIAPTLERMVLPKSGE